MKSQNKKGLERQKGDILEWTAEIVRENEISFAARTVSDGIHGLSVCVSVCVFVHNCVRIFWLSVYWHAKFICTKISYVLYIYYAKLQVYSLGCLCRSLSVLFHISVHHSGKNLNQWKTHNSSIHAPLLPLFFCWYVHKNIYIYIYIYIYRLKHRLQS